MVCWRKGSLAFRRRSYSSRSFCPKGSSDVQNRLWCQYESSIVRLGTDNALGRLFIYKSARAHRCLSLSEFKLNGSLSVTQKGLAQADKNHPESVLSISEYRKSSHPGLERGRCLPNAGIGLGSRTIAGTTKGAAEERFLIHRSAFKSCCRRT